MRGPHVYVAYNHAQKVWVSSSHDGGATFTWTNLLLDVSAAPPDCSDHLCSSAYLGARPPAPPTPSPR